MAAFTKLNGFVEHLAEGVHDLATHQLRVALSNTAPGSESTPPTGATTACILGNVTQIAYTNLASDPTSRNLTVSSSSQTSGTYKLVLADLVLTASGGALPTFRYIYIFNLDTTGAADPLIGYYDYGSAVDLADTETFTINFDDAAGVLTIA
jgi:hypothetical protein